MAQLDFCSYFEQSFLVFTTFWLFFAGCVRLFIAPFSEVMKVRGFVSNCNCKDEDETLINEIFFSSNKAVPEKILVLFQ